MIYDIVNFSLNEKGIVNSLVEKKAQELLGLYYPISLDFSVVLLGRP